MFEETLTLEVQATKLHWAVVKPPVLTGRSGVEHAFSFLATDGAGYHGFDICKKVCEIDVLKTYIKKFDTKASTDLISSSGEADPVAEKLAKEYQMEIICGDEIPKYFESKYVGKVKARRSSGPTNGKPPT